MDPQTGVVARTIPLAIMGTVSLAWDGTHFLVLGMDEKDKTQPYLFFLDSRSGAVVKKIPLRYAAAAVAFDRGVLYLADQPDRYYYDKQHRQTWPWSRKIHRLTSPGCKASPTEGE